MPLRVAEVEAKSVLNRSGIAEWTVNCYAGCQHGCVYCYARFATRFSHPNQPWGSFVDAKINAPELLSREVGRKRAGEVFVSSVCDPWQPLEARYGLTRRCLEILLRSGFRVRTLTKSTLAARDLDIMAAHRDLVEFGVTITTLDPNLVRLLEPVAAAPDRRIGLLAEAKSKGLRTYAFLGPLMPGLADGEEQMVQLVKAAVDAGADYLLVDRLNPRFGVWGDLKAMLLRHYPELVQEYRAVLYDPLYRDQYTTRLRDSMTRLLSRHGLEGRARLCF